MREAASTMRFSTTQIRSILSHIAATGVLFEPDEAVDDLPGVLSEYGITANLSLRERYALVRELAHIAETGEPLFDRAEDLGIDADAEGRDLDTEDEAEHLESMVRSEDDASDLGKLVPPPHPDYLVEDEEQPQDRLRLPRVYTVPDPYEPEYDDVDFGYTGGDVP